MTQWDNFQVPGRIEVLTSNLFGNYDRPTDKPIDRSTDRLGHREVTFS